MPRDINLLMTEQRNSNTLHIDEMDTLGIVEAINNEDQQIALAVKKVLPNVVVAIDDIYDSLQNGGRLIYIGAGTSGRLGVLDASECPPTYGVDASMIQGIIAGGPEALLVAKEGAEDSLTLAVSDLQELHLNDKDVVCGLAASGRTPYVIGGLQYANKVGAKTISICCVEIGEISKYAKQSIEILVGPEVITGSTRMKAGTAQKLVLNMLTTTVMIKLGKVYGNLMVDVKPTNDKLVKRATNIIVECTNVSKEKATDFLQKSGNNVKVAILMALTGSTVDVCKDMLDTNNQNVAKAIRLYKGY
ncbi:MAG: N-acetylmuramic acid 6-phosphate etherase [Coprobacillaceae bacterium]